MKHSALAVIGGMMIVAFSSMAADRIGVVATQDRTGSGLSTAILDDQLKVDLLASGFEVVPLRFAPPADVDHEARMAGCNYLLYTDIARAGKVRRPFAKPADESEVEFRLFRLDEGIPMLSTSVTARSKGIGFGPAAQVIALEREAKSVRSALSNPARQQPGEYVASR